MMATHRYRSETRKLEPDVVQWIVATGMGMAAMAVATILVVTLI
jgi:uridine phosphorylase